MKIHIVSHQDKELIVGLKIHPTSNVGLLKTKIREQLSIPESYQSLSIDGIAMDDDHQPISAYPIAEWSSVRLLVRSYTNAVPLFFNVQGFVKTRIFNVVPTETSVAQMKAMIRSQCGIRQDKRLSMYFDDALMPDDAVLSHYEEISDFSRIRVFVGDY